jgi:hypothetical protein
MTPGVSLIKLSLFVTDAVEWVSYSIWFLKEFSDLSDISGKYTSKFQALLANISLVL